MSTMLKKWAVRQLADALADYLEGVTPETVHARLGTDTGRLDLKARVNPSALKSLRLEVLDSEVDLHVMIPWRHLNTEATEFTIRSFKLEVRLVPIGAGTGVSTRSGMEIEKQRADKEAAVQHILKSSNTDEQAVGGVGRAARASHAILQRLRASVQCLELRLNRQAWQEEPALFSVLDMDLLSVGPDWTGEPDPGSQDLHKVFRFRELSVRGAGSGRATANPGGGTQRPAGVGPLALEVRLHHSPASRVLHLRAEIAAESSCACVDAGVARTLRRVLQIAMEPDPDLMATASLPESAGHEYALLCSRRLDGERVDEARLREIEDIAPAEWIAAWRGHVNRLRMVVTAGEVSKKQSRKNKSSSKGWSWSKQAETSPARAGSGGSDSPASGHFGFEELLDDAIQAGLAPEVNLPTSLSLDASVPRFEFVAVGKASELKFSWYGMSLHLDLKAIAPTVCQTTPFLWKAASRLELGSFGLMLDNEPLALPRGGKALTGEGSTTGQEERWQDGASSAVAVDSSRSVVYLELAAEQRDIQVTGAPPFDVSLFFMQDLVTIHLSSWRIHGALSNAVEVFTALTSPLRDDAGAEFVDAVDDEAALNDLRARAVSTLHLPPAGDMDDDSDDGEDESESGDVSVSMRAALADKQATFKLHVHVDSPVIRWEEPQSRCALETRLGSLRVRTCKSGGCSADDVKMEAVTLAAFGAFAELRDQSLSLTDGSACHWVYKPATMMCRMAKDANGAVQLNVDAPAIKLFCSPMLVAALGELKWGLDYALSPLYEVGKTAEADGAKEGSTPAEGAANLAGGADADSPSAGMSLDVQLQLFELCWTLDGSTPEILVGFGQTQVRLKQFAAGTTVGVDLTRLRLEAAGREIVECQEALHVEINFGTDEFLIDLDAPPVALVCAAEPLRAVVRAGRVAGERFSEGMAVAGKVLPLSDNVGVSTRLWNRYVLERAQRLGEDYLAKVNAELEQLGFGTATAVAPTASAVATLPAGARPPEESPAAPPSSQVFRLTIKLSAMTMTVEGDVDARPNAVPVGLVASRARMDFERLPTGARMEVKLASVNVDMGQRRIITPRRENVDLLSVTASAEHGQVPVVELHWEQIVVVYRQRDMDELITLLTEEAVGYFSSGAREDDVTPVAALADSASGPAADAGVAAGRPPEVAPPAPSPPVSTPAAAEGEFGAPGGAPSSDAAVSETGAPSLRYSLSILAPLVYCPAETHLRAGAANALPDAAATARGDASPGAAAQQRRRGMAVPPAEPTPAHLEVVGSGGEPRFVPARGEGYLVIDFGCMNMKQGATWSAVDITLRDARMVVKEPEQPQADVLHTLSLGVTVTTPGNRKVDVAMWSPLEEQVDGYRLSLTRAQLSLILDFAALNVCYPSDVIAPAVPSARRPSRPDILQDAEPAPLPRTISFALNWRGPLRFDLAFTKDTPLASAQLLDGRVEYNSSVEGSSIGVRIKSFCCQDTRVVARNADKLFLEGCAAEQEACAFNFVMRFPSTGSQSALEVNIVRPVLLLLPGLFTDLSTWCLSAYQQSSWSVGGEDAAPEAFGGGAPDEQVEERSKNIDVNIWSAAVKFPCSWSDPGDYIEVVGGLSASILMSGQVTRITDLSLMSGKLRHVESNGPQALLCGKVEISAQGSIQTTQDEMKNVRTNVLTFELIQLRPLRICVSPAEYRALCSAILNLAEFDADSAEPAEELRQRDPLALVMQSRLAVAASIEVSPITLQLLESAAIRGASGGAVRVAAELELACPLAQLSLNSMVGGEMSMSFHVERADANIRNYNVRIGDWEPVLSPSKFSLTFTAHPEHVGEAVTFRLCEGGDEVLDGSVPEYSVVRAWWGDRRTEWSDRGGVDVTEHVRKLLAGKKPVKASNELFGDPAPRTLKALLVEIRHRGVMRFEVTTSPLHLIVTTSLLELGSRLLPALQGGDDSAVATKSAAQSPDVLRGMNLTGRTCAICCQGEEEVPSDVYLPPCSNQVSLDAVLQQWDGSGPLPKVRVWLVEPEDASEIAPDSPAEAPLRKVGEACDVLLEAEGVKAWLCTERGPAFVVRVVAPRPLQRLLLISTALSISNITPRDLEVRFLPPARAGGAAAPLTPLPADDLPRCVPTRWLDAAHAGYGESDSSDDEGASGPPSQRREVTVGTPPGASRFAMSAPSAATSSRAGSVRSSTSPVADAMVTRALIVEVLSVEGLTAPDLHVADHMRRFLPGSRTLHPYIVVRVARSQVQETPVARAPKGSADIQQRLVFLMREASTKGLSTLHGKEITFDILDKKSGAGVTQGDTRLGTATLRLSDEELLPLEPPLGREEGAKRLTVFRNSKERGCLVVRVRAEMEEDEHGSLGDAFGTRRRRLSTAEPLLPSIAAARPVSASAAAAPAVGAAAAARGDSQGRDAGVYCIPAGYTLAVPPEAVVVGTSWAASSYSSPRQSPRRRRGPPASPDSSGSGRSKGSESAFDLEDQKDDAEVSAPLAGSTPECRLQVRPAEAGHTWGEELRFDFLAAQSKAFISQTTAAAEHIPTAAGATAAASQCRLLVEALLCCTASGAGLHELRVGAPARLANALPCDVLVQLGRSRAEHLGSSDGACPADGMIRVLDGAGGLWEVPPNGCAEICPVRPDAERQFSWCTEDGKREKVQKVTCEPGTNFVKAVRCGGHVSWLFCRVKTLDVMSPPMRLDPRQEVSIFDEPAEGLMFSVALLEQFTGEQTTWSDPLPVLMPPFAALQAPVRPRLHGQDIQLGAAWQPGRRSVIFARTWFVDATGLGVGVSPTPQHKKLPCFGNSIFFCGELVGESPQICLSTPGEGGTNMSIPVLGNSTSLKLSPVHECALMVESLSSVATFGIPCTLMTVVPGLMVFSSVEGCQVGFRQQGSDDVVWVDNKESSPFYWSKADKPKRVEVACRLRPQYTDGATPKVSGAYVFSAPLDIAEAHIGSVPMLFPLVEQAPSHPRLICLHLDEAGDLFTLSASGEETCHQLVNKHCCLVLEASFEAEDSRHRHSFVAHFGERIALGRPCTIRCRERLRLLLADTKDCACSWSMEVDLLRASTTYVPSAAAGEPPRPQAMVTVQLVKRIAVITVNPVVSAVSQTSGQVDWGWELEVSVPRLTWSLIGEQPRGEAFTITMNNFHIRSKQTAAGFQESELIVERLQVDAQQPRPMPVLASVASPLLRLVVIREDIAARDVRLRRVDIRLGRVEVTADDDFITAATRWCGHATQALARSRSGPSAGAGAGTLAGVSGLDFEVAVARAGLPYNLTCGGPAPPSSKYILHELLVGEINLRLFCRLSPHIFPRWILALVTVLSFSSTMEVDGAKVKLPEQKFFDRSSVPFEGSLGALWELMNKRYVKLYPKAIVSMVNNSNLILGGLLSRHRFFPKDRLVQKTLSPPLLVSHSGAVSPVMPDVKAWTGDAPARIPSGMSAKLTG